MKEGSGRADARERDRTSTAFGKKKPKREPKRQEKKVDGKDL